MKNKWYELNKKYLVAIVIAIIIIGIAIFSNAGITKTNNTNMGQNQSLNVAENSSISTHPNTGRHLTVSINETVSVKANP